MSTSAKAMLAQSDPESDPKAIPRRLVLTLTSWTWLSLALLYAAFFGWYTSFGGPLSPEEIEHYIERMGQIIGSE